MIAATVREIPLTQGKVAIVDAADFDLVSKHRWHAVKIGNTFYARTKISLGGSKQKNLSMHRLILGADDPRLIDHADCNGLNNRRSNLRYATRSQNNQNKRTKSKHGFKGVHPIKNTARWQALLKIEGQWHYRGPFPTPEDAAKAYDEMAREFFGEFARLNFPAEASA